MFNSKTSIEHGEGYGNIWRKRVIGSQEYKRLYINNLVEEWAKMINRLSDFGQSQPQAAYAAFTHGVKELGNGE